MILDVPEPSDRPGHRLHRLVDHDGELHQVLLHDRDVVHPEAVHDVVDHIRNVVELLGEGVNILAIERGDEGLVQLIDDGVRHIVALVLDGRHLAQRIFRDGALRHNFFEELGGMYGVADLLFKQLKEVERLGKEPENHAHLLFPGDRAPSQPLCTIHREHRQAR